MRKRQASIAVKIKILPVSAGGRAPIEVSVLPHSEVASSSASCSRISQAIPVAQIGLQQAYLSMERQRSFNLCQRRADSRPGIAISRLWPASTPQSAICIKA